MSNIRRALDSWERGKERAPDRFTRSGIPVKALYTPLDVGGGYVDKLGFPGEYPFTRGIHGEMYRKRLWTIREFSGYGDAIETNRRLKYLLQQGETGLSIAFDYPTLLGLDSDDELSRGEFGRAGVGISTLDDMELMFQDIPLGTVSTSMTINGPAAVIWAFYILAAEHQGVLPAGLRGTIQNDILKEYMAQKSYIFPPEPSLKLVVDTIEYSSKALPQWNPISISGYHIREAGATAVQELAFTIANGLTYVEEAVGRGLDIDDFAPRLSFFFDSSIYFFEEIAKFRAARRIWAREIRSRHNPKKERSMWMRFHTQTSGVSLTAQQPENNIVRTAIEAMAAVLGGTQSLHTNAMDEAWGLPTELAATIALRTQQIIAEESGLPDTVDPAGGSYYLEWLTDKMEEEAYAYLDRINAIGGVVKGIKSGFFQREIAESSYKYQKEVEENKRIIVGVNAHIQGKTAEIPVLKVSERYERRQISRLKEYRRNRDDQKVRQALNHIQKVAWEENLMPGIMSAAKAGATLGEIIGTMKDVWGEYREPVIF
ncbi:MAG: methylmalonyl-CoA mutase family protein [Thaumarchaeota archaeon]|jgi:methylmalonyl-CoA mutase N-terminal domain/subunit|nr:methylmalonyl-CoA mutase family protein [Nitrososphaerota archaeon]